MKIIFRLIIFFSAIILFTDISAQEINLPLGHEMSQTIEASINTSNYPINTGFKPLRISETNRDTDMDSLLFTYQRDVMYAKWWQKNAIYRKLFYENFIGIEKSDYSIYINPLFYIEYDKSEDSSKLFSINTRGLEIKGFVGSKLGFYTAFRENQAFFRPYITQKVNERLIVPGQGAPKTYKTTGFDFASSVAYLSYSPVAWFNVQIGNDKNFVGEGYRSVLLSDNAFNYPNIKFTTNYKGLKYVSVFAQLEDFENVYYDRHITKHAAFNFVSYSFKNIFELGFFEGMIFQTSDTAKYINKIPPDYFIPIIGVHTAKYGFYSNNNLLVGLNAKVKITRQIQLYGQFALNNPEKSKYAYQGGIKIFDMFLNQIRKQKLYFQFEYNKASAGTYADRNKFMSWSHYNQELAHPLGGSFGEIFTEINYRFYKFDINLKYTKAIVNEDDMTSDIYLATQNPFSSGSENQISHKIITIDWIRNPRTFFVIFTGLDIRTFNNRNEKYLFVGFRTQLSNFYYDF